MDDQVKRAALITGGTSGLGLTVATELARQGWNLFLQHSGAGENADEIAADLLADAKQDKIEIDVTAAACDLASAADRNKLVEEMLDEFGRIDMLVNSATGKPPKAIDLLEVSEDDYREVIDTGLTSTLFLTQLVANEMVRLVEAGEIENPRIVTLNSITSYTTSVDHGPHCISRAGLSMMTQLFADRLGEHGISVYEIRAGLLSTGPGDAAHAMYDTLIEQGLTPIRRWGRPADVARAVSAIAQDMLSFSTGEVINVDGGFHLRRL